jgi:hypothetical protein
MRCTLPNINKIVINYALVGIAAPYFADTLISGLLTTYVAIITSDGRCQNFLLKFQRVLYKFTNKRRGQCLVCLSVCGGHDSSENKHTSLNVGTCFKINTICAVPNIIKVFFIFIYGVFYRRSNINQQMHKDF